MEPLLPDRTPKRGGRWRDHREVIDAIAFTFRTGTQWVHLPERYGNWRGVHNRLRMWAVDGTWERVFTAVVAPRLTGRRPRHRRRARSGTPPRPVSDARPPRPPGRPARPRPA
ncbi:transposase [Streptomyces olivaceoviridis]|uniref:transposase n=1 Tax=Streptomyces olivaceoviridis TaxID=1921 RepID=UPI0036FF8488